MFGWLLDTPLLDLDFSDMKILILSDLWYWSLEQGGWWIDYPFSPAHLQLDISIFPTLLGQCSCIYKLLLVAFDFHIKAGQRTQSLQFIKSCKFDKQVPASHIFTPHSKNDLSNTLHNTRTAEVLTKRPKRK